MSTYTKHKSPLHWAASDYNDISQVKELISQGVDINISLELGFTPLHSLVIENYDDSHFEVAEFLLKNGPDANAIAIVGVSPLDWLIGNANVRMLNLFLDYKAEPSFGSKDTLSYSKLQLTVKMLKLYST